MHHEAGHPANSRKSSSVVPDEDNVRKPSAFDMSLVPNADTPWRQALQSVIDEPHLSEYVDLLRHHCLDFRGVACLTPEDMNTLNIRIGHRKIITRVALRNLEAKAELNALASSTARHRSVSTPDKPTDNPFVVEDAMGGRHSFDASENHEKKDADDGKIALTIQIPTPTARACPSRSVQPALPQVASNTAKTTTITASPSSKKPVHVSGFSRLLNFRAAPVIKATTASTAAVQQVNEAFLAEDADEDFSEFRALSLGSVKAASYSKALGSSANMQGSRSDRRTPSPPAPPPYEGLEPNGCGIKWMHLSGLRSTAQELVTEVRGHLEALHFPSFFSRLFQDNHTMPTTMTTMSGSSFGILLRVPRLVNSPLVGDNAALHGQDNVSALTQRVVILCSLDSNTIITYFSCPAKKTSRCELSLSTAPRPGEVDEEEECTDHPFESIANMWKEGKYAYEEDICVVIQSMLRLALKRFHAAGALLRSEIELMYETITGSNAKSQQSENNFEIIQRLSTVQRQGYILKRCSLACEDAVEELGNDVEAMKYLMKYVVESLNTIHSTMDDLATHSRSGIDLTIALSEFRSNSNLKLFTYVTILLQPVSLAGTWYGMNFDIPEVSSGVEGYIIFAVVVWSISLAILLAVLYREGKWAAWWGK